MKPFTEWITTGPLSFERITAREKLIAEIAYTAGAAEHIEDAREAFDRILQGVDAQARVS